jgi:hypothetical protein
MKLLVTLAALCFATAAQASTPTSIGPRLEQQALGQLTLTHKLSPAQQAIVRPLLLAYLAQRQDVVAESCQGCPAKLEAALLDLRVAFQAQVRQALKKVN